MSHLTNRHDFIVLFDVQNGNPNGDPDAGNLPRIDPETNCGLVTDVSLKRKVRNYIELAKGEEAGFGIYVKEGSILNEQHRKAYIALRPDDEKVAKEKKLNPQNDEEALRLRDFMCKNFYDVRAFGAVMGTGINCGQVRGPVQFTFGQSIEPVIPQEISITRMAATSEKEKAAQIEGSDSNDRTENRTMGRKYIIPYGLYRAHGFISAKLSERTSFSEDDLDTLLDAIKNMFEHDRSAARGEMAVRKLIVFRHESALGNAPAHTLFEAVKVERTGDKDKPARSYADYSVKIDREGIPPEVELLSLL